MARLKGVPIEKVDGATKAAYDQCREKFGRVVEPIAIMAHHPTLLEGYGRFELAFHDSSAVSRKLRSLAFVRTSAMVGCPY
jgi:hypothetical protein